MGHHRQEDNIQHSWDLLNNVRVFWGYLTVMPSITKGGRPRRRMIWTNQLDEFRPDHVRPKIPKPKFASATNNFIAAVDRILGDCLAGEVTASQLSTKDRWPLVLPRQLPNQAGKTTLIWISDDLERIHPLRFRSRVALLPYLFMWGVFPKWPRLT